MTEILVATPLPNNVVGGEIALADGLWVKKLDPIQYPSEWFSERDKREIAGHQYWLGINCDSRTLLPKNRYERLARGLYATQILCPSQISNVYLTLVRTADGFVVDHFNRYSPMKSTHVGYLSATRHFAEEFNLVFAGIEKAFANRVVRLQNPILLLEHGLQIDNPPLRILFFSMAMDMLYMAGGIVRFVERINRFLDADSYIFPGTESLNLQPAITVGEIVEDLYKLRNIVAHGQEILEVPYRRRKDILATDGSCLNNTYELCYVDVLAECSLFLLQRSLFKIFTEGLGDQVAQEKAWRKILNGTS